MTTTLGIHPSRFILKLSSGLYPPEQCHEAFSRGHKHTSQVVGRSLLLELDGLPSDAEFERGMSANRTTPTTESIRAELLAGSGSKNDRTAHAMNETLNDYIKELSATLGESQAQRKVRAAAAGEDFGLGKSPNPATTSSDATSAPADTYTSAPATTSTSGPATSTASVATKPPATTSFGANLAPSTTSIFGAAPATATTTTAAPANTSIFGIKPASETTPAPAATNLFGTASATTINPASTTNLSGVAPATTTASVHGTTPTPASSLGASALFAAPLFSAQTTGESGGLFSTKTTGDQAKDSPSTGVIPSGGLFGNLGGTGGTTSSGLGGLFSGITKPGTESNGLYGSVNESESLSVALNVSECEILNLNSGIHKIVNSEEYSKCLNRPDLLRVIALEAEGLPKKLARTMASMAEQKSKLESTLSKLCKEEWISTDQSIQNLNQKISEYTPSTYTWKTRCDAPVFVFVQELLKNLVQAYLSQAHQASTVWSFSHFIALLLRSTELKNIVEPLWIYNVCTHTHVNLLIYDRLDSTAAHVIRLYTAVLICLPDYAKVWSFTAGLVNDMANDEEQKLKGKEALSMLNATLGLAKVFLAEVYPTHWPKFEEVVRQYIDKELKPKADDNESRVNIVQLEEALSAKQKPEAYTLTAREKQLTVD